MSSKSASTEVTEDHTKNIAIDRRAVQESGQQIVDSIILDQSPETVRETMKTLLAAWQTMTHGNALNLVEVVDLGHQVLKFADKSQIALEGVAYETLKNGLAEFEELMRLGALSVEMAENVATHAIDTTADVSANALNVVAEVADGSSAENLKVISLAVMAFASFAIFLAMRNNSQ